MTDAPDFNKIGWAPWMEDTISHMIEDKVETIVLVAFCADGKTALAYTDDTTVQDLAMASFWCHKEAMNIANECDESEESEEE